MSSSTPSSSTNAISELLSPSGTLSNFLLPFHTSIVRNLIPLNDEPLDEGDALTILAKGLGLRSIVASVLKIYDGPRNLVIVVNATPDEESSLGEELTILGAGKPGLRVVGYEMGAKQRSQMYLSGGLLSVTSRILVVDMLNKRVPTELITGLVVLHAEKVSPTSVEAFIVRIFRQENKDGFLKAFSDDPEHFSYGISPLQTVLTQLQIRKVDLWPRFHKSVTRDLGARKADVIELYQPLSKSMRNIQNAIVECLDATLNELKKSSKTIDIEDYNVENAIFRAFDVLVRRQLDPVWHQLSPKTKQLVADLRTLRNLLSYLLTYDAVGFYSYLETIQASNKNNSTSGSNKYDSPWLAMEAANVIFSEARARVYIGKVEAPSASTSKTASASTSTSASTTTGSAANTSNDETIARALQNEMDADEEDALNEARHPRANGGANGLNSAERAARARRAWLPPGIEPVLEELPKWHLLREVLDEIEQEIHFGNQDLTGPMNNTILIMTGSDRTCTQLREYLSSMNSSVLSRVTSGAGMGNGDDDDRSNSPGRALMEKYLRNYFFWKGGLGQTSSNLSNSKSNSSSTFIQENGVPQANPNSRAALLESEALKRKAAFTKASGQKRRRQRGGAGAGGPGRAGKETGPAEAEKEAEDVASFMQRSLDRANDDSDLISESDESDTDEPGVSLHSSAARTVNKSTPSASSSATARIEMKKLLDQFSEVDFNAYFGLLSMENLVVVRSYTEDEDDKVLQELRPRFVVLYDPTPSFIRRIEVYRSLNSEAALRVYFLMYKDSVEEQRYLSGMRREKESFEKLIREKSIMALPIQADGRPAPDSDTRLLRSISSRMAGGQSRATSEPPRIIVDMREFRSSLPSMLHAAGIQVVPCTLQVGDYILSPTMCVERKSLSDLIQSFNSGRLYTQCEMMSIHYQHPILLIEFDQEKSFSLQSLNETKGGNPKNINKATKPSEIETQAKLVILTTSFPRLRVIWSSSPYATADIFADLKSNYDEPDVQRVASIGTDGTTDSTALGQGSLAGEQTYNLIPQDVLLSLPGINSKNFRHVMNMVRDLKELFDLSLEEMKFIIGSEPGKLLFDFVNRDPTAKRKARMADATYLFQDFRKTASKMGD